MNFELNEEQEAVRELAEQIFSSLSSVERVKEIEASDDRIDRDLWSALADANILGLAIPETYGGSDLGLLELTLALEQQGRVVAPVPLAATTVSGALAISEFGTDAQKERILPGVVKGKIILSAALAEIGVNDPLNPQVQATLVLDRWSLSGTKFAVPAGMQADILVVPARTPDGVAVFLVDTNDPSLSRVSAFTTDRSQVAHVTFLDSPAEMLGDGGHPGERIVQWILDRSIISLCAIQIGVCEAAVKMAANYTSAREQFGRPLSAFQATQVRAADAYIDTEAIRVTTLLAAWKADAGQEITADALVAKWWAAEAGQRVVHAVQHLHGGVGADIEYPVHRYFLWGKQIEDTLGGANATLESLGRVLAKMGV